ncbi:MAG: RES family NAD+ phosphorylase [Pseudomonadota bacterium]
MLPDVQELFDIISTLCADAPEFNGVIVRSVATRYANRNDFFSGTGAARSGGRWNPVGLPAIYASLDIRTATEEAYQNFNTFGFPLTAIQPRVTAGARVTLASVFDLSNGAVRRAIGFSKSDLCREDWKAIQENGEESWTQTIGKAAAVAGFEGLVAPSARLPQGRNIVIFPKNLANPGQITIIGEDQLPK